jgi:hypothetical protein
VWLESAVNRVPFSWIVAAALWAVGSMAQAAYVVESVPLTTRQAADAELGRVQGAISPADRDGLVLRVVRRYVRGTGWRYFVAVEQIPNAAHLLRTAPALTIDGAPGSAYQTDGMDRRPVPIDGGSSDVPAATPAPAPARPAAVPTVKAPAAAAGPTPVPAAAGPDRSRARSAQAVLRAASRAHGGVDGGALVLDQAPAVSFRFTRTLPSAAGVLRARHHLVQQGDAARVEVEVLEGDGQSSRMGIDITGRAWLQVGEGDVLSRDPSPVREIIARFDPRSVLDSVVDLPRAIETGIEWRGLERSGPPDTVEVVLRPILREGASMPADGMVEAAFDADTHRLVRMVWQQGPDRTTFLYDGYREVAPGLIIPAHVRVMQAKDLVEDIVIDELKTRTEVPPSRFASPEG